MAGLQPTTPLSMLPEADGSLIYSSLQSRSKNQSPRGHLGSKTQVSNAHLLLAANSRQGRAVADLHEDHGADGKVPSILWPADLVTSEMVAGSMGMIVRVPAVADLLNFFRDSVQGPTTS